MATRLEKPFSIKLIGLENPIRFETLDDLEKWATSELDFWCEDGKPIPFRSPSEPAYKHQFNTISQLVKVISGAKGHQDQPYLAGQWDEIHKILTRVEDRKTVPFFLHSLEPVAQYIRKMLKEDEDLALPMLWISQGRDIDSNLTNGKNFSNTIRAATELRLFERGIVGNVDAERNALEKLRTEFAEKLGELKQRLAQAAESLESWNTQADEQTLSLQKEFQKLLKDSKIKFDELEVLFKEKLRLEGPVHYWTKKQATHRSTAIFSGIAFVVVIAAVLGILYCYHSQLLEITTALKDTSLSLLLLVVAPAFAVIWMLRLVSRIFLTNFSLYNDAKERVVMANTFLALVKDAGEIDKAERILVLQAMFRPSGAPSEEDAAPPHWIDVVLQRFQK